VVSECVKLPLVAVTVTLPELGGLIVTVTVAVPPEERVTETCESVTVAPAGFEVTARDTVPENPFTELIVML